MLVDGIAVPHIFNAAVYVVFFKRVGKALVELYRLVKGFLQKLVVKSAGGDYGVNDAVL